MSLGHNEDFDAMSFELDYDDLLPLDAEDLAEGGIGAAYEALLPDLRQIVAQPAEITEELDDETPRYIVRCGGKEFPIYGPELPDDEGESWGRATNALFAIVNDQLGNSNYRFYAICGGNDLGGIFLTSAQAEAARTSLAEKRDWPYLPTNDPPWYGLHH